MRYASVHEWREIAIFSGNMLVSEPAIQVGILSGRQTGQDADTRGHSVALA